MPKCPHEMIGPEHLFQFVTSPQTWRHAFERHVAEGKRRYPRLVWPSAWRSVASVTPLVARGSWKVQCATPGCGEQPLLSFEWGGLSICFNCGAIYEGVPEPRDRREIERVLLERPDPSTRNWNWPMLDGTETVDDLTRENAAHGVGAGL